MARYEIPSSKGEQVSKTFKLKPRHIIEAMEDCQNRIQYILDANGVGTEEELALTRAERCYQSQPRKVDQKGDHEGDHKEDKDSS